MLTKKCMGLLLTVVLAAAIIVGCGSSDSSSSDSSSSDSSSSDSSSSDSSSSDSSETSSEVLYSYDDDYQIGIYFYEDSEYTLENDDIEYYSDDDSGNLSDDVYFEGLTTDDDNSANLGITINSEDSLNEYLDKLTDLNDDDDRTYDYDIDETVYTNDSGLNCMYINADYIDEDFTYYVAIVYNDDYTGVSIVSSDSDILDEIINSISDIELIEE